MPISLVCNVANPSVPIANGLENVGRAVQILTSKSAGVAGVRTHASLLVAGTLVE